jgi:regulator of protease activity HflC (stomatin/prohibitin superfamily)
MPWFTKQPEPSNVGEPQSVRDAWDKQLKAQADANAQIEEALSEIEIN